MPLNAEKLNAIVVPLCSILINSVLCCLLAFWNNSIS